MTSPDNSKNRLLLPERAVITETLRAYRTQKFRDHGPRLSEPDNSKKRCARTTGHDETTGHDDE